MITTDLNGCKVVLYNNSEALPPMNFVAYNRLVLFDAEIGGDLNGVMQHFDKMLAYCRKGETKKLEKQLGHYRQCLTFIVANTSPRLLSFVPLIHSIDGELVQDFSYENMNEILQRLGKKGLTIKIIDKFLDYIKMRLTPTLN